MGIGKSKQNNKSDSSSYEMISPKYIPYMDEFTINGKYGPLKLMKGKYYQIINNNDYYYSGNRLKRATAYVAKFKGSASEYLEFENVISYSFDGYSTSTYKDPNPLKVYKDSLDSYNIFEIDSSEKDKPFQFTTNNYNDSSSYNNDSSYKSYDKFGGKKSRKQKAKKYKKSHKSYKKKLF